MKLGNTPKLSKYQISINGFILIHQDWYAESFEELAEKVIQQHLDNQRTSNESRSYSGDNRGYVSFEITNVVVEELEAEKWEIAVHYSIRHRSFGAPLEPKITNFIAKKL